MPNNGTLFLFENGWLCALKVNLNWKVLRIQSLVFYPNLREKLQSGSKNFVTIWSMTNLKHSCAKNWNGWAAGKAIMINSDLIKLCREAKQYTSYYIYLKHLFKQCGKSPGKNFPKYGSMVKKRYHVS